MKKSEEEELTDLSLAFLRPKNATHRRYEALRAFFVEHVPSAEAARRFGYTPGSFRVLCHEFRLNPNRQFFLTPERRRPAAKSDPWREKIIELRKQNLSIYDIHRELAHAGGNLSPVAISTILREEGFARLPRRGDEERPQIPKPEKADVADVRALDLSPRTFRTQFGGLFLFVPFLAEIGVENIVARADLPGSKMIPAACAIRSLLGMKLFGRRRHSHVMSYVMDDGLALFAGLNAIPKRAFLTEYSGRIHPASYPKLMKRWFDGATNLGLARGVSFNLDFHTIPFHGEDALVEKHYLTNRSRRQKGILAFLAEDAENRVFCYANGHVRKADQNDEVLRFVEYWKERTGRLPEELVFDSKLTTYANLNRLNAMNIPFITLRRRSAKRLAELRDLPPSAWRRIELESISRMYRTPRILDRRISLQQYDKPIREICIADLGHEEPTIMLTNQLKRSASKLIGRYAKRMIVENTISDGIEFFHMDALSSAVAMKVDCDLQLTLMASSLYRLLGSQIGEGYDHARAQHIFRDFVDAVATVSIDEKDIVVRFQKRAHNPLLLAAGFGKKPVRVPWLGRKALHLVFG